MTSAAPSTDRPTPASTEAQARALRAQLEARLPQWPEVMPQAMRDRSQWLLWRLEWNDERECAVKAPYYAGGRRRAGKLGGPDDLAALSSIDVVLARFRASQRWTGIGFAFLEGDDLIAIDLDSTYDLHTGEVREEHLDIIDACGSYTERSPSRAGVHIICSGSIPDSFKHDPCGVEVYAGGRYFTCTGDRVESSPAEVQPLKRFAHRMLQDIVQRSKEAAKAAKAVAAAPAASAPPRPSTRPAAAGEGGDDFRRVNDEALRALDAWVPLVLPDARRWGGGYRITSKALGRDLQEDLQLLPEGIMDFGEERGCSAIDVVLKWGRQPSAVEAMRWLAERLDVQLSAPPARRQGSRRPEPPPLPPEDDGPRPPLQEPVAGDATPAGEQLAEQVERQAEERRASMRLVHDAEKEKRGEAAAAKEKRRGKGKGADAPAEGGGGAVDDDDIDWSKFRHLRQHFALIYGTDTVYDGEHGIIMKIANMAHAHGTAMVRLWKGGTAAKRRSEDGRWTVMPECVVFDPTEKADPETHINLYRGFPTKPKRDGNIAPLLELLTHLCSRAGETEEECAEIRHYLLCWLAYPIQHRGAKLRTAVIMHGDEGAGKNFLTDLVVEMYGEYGATVGQDELEDKFNDWRSRKMLVVGDEVSSRAELVHNKNRLKALITSTTVQINPKNLPRREEKNHINVWFNSNELQPAALDNSDRRYLVIFTPPAKDFEFYRALGEWKQANGAGVLLDYLMRYPLDEFDPFAPAPVTKAKLNLIDLNRKSPERFWIEWSDGQLDLPYWSCSLAQAYEAYLKYCQRTGERYPEKRNQFTAQLLRVSDTMRRPCVEKVMKVRLKPNGEAADDDDRSGSYEERAMRMLCVVPPPPTAMGQWASDAFRAFEGPLGKYLRRSVGQNDGGGDGMWLRSYEVA